LKVSWRKIQITNFKWKYQRNKKQININHKKDMFLPHILNDILMKLCHSFLRLNYVLYGFFSNFVFKLLSRYWVISWVNYSKKKFEIFLIFPPKKILFNFQIRDFPLCTSKVTAKEKIWFLNSKINLSWLVC